MARAAAGPQGGGRLTDSVDEFTRELAATADGDRIAVRVMSDVLAGERRPSRVGPLLDAWGDRFAGAVRRGDHDDAASWMQILVDDVEWSEDLAPLVEGVLDRVTTPDLVEILVLDLQRDAVGGLDLLARWGRRLVPCFLDWIVVDDPPVSRKHVVDHLGVIARSDVGALLPHLQDDRWFVVRNFATAVGRSGSQEAVEPLTACLAHADDRVRVEAVRGIAALRGDAALTALVDALADDSERVRGAAISLLRAIRSDDVSTAIEAVIDERGVDAGDVRRLVSVIEDRGGPDADRVLERLAARRPVFGARKVARDAAREALERRA
ncbi:MAG: HEAT repeat domain-containing protein [Acidimicrobiia bacterium]|nr:HEAT repeat domain-containing protein [Acidimicrobiia bacterium]